MSERRFVVEITHPVPEGDVANVAALVAQRLDMEPQRIVTLLSGRVGAVTKAVLPDKAVAIADVFAAAGVQVAVLPAAEPAPTAPAATTAAPAATAAPEPEQSPATTGHQPEQSGADAENEPGRHQDPYYATVEEPYEAEDELGPEEDDSGQYAADDDDDYEQDYEHEEPYPYADLDQPEPDAEPAAHGHDAAHDHDAAHAKPYVAPADWRPQGWTDEEATDWGVLRPGRTGAAQGNVEEIDDEPPEQAHAHDEPDHASDTAWSYDDHDPELEDEADRLGPRPAGSGASLFSTSTRWVPSPHDEYGFDPDEVPIVPPESGQPATWDEGRMTSAGRGVTGRARASAADLGAPLEPAPREGPRLRVYLMWGLIVSIVLFLLLQFVMADRVSSSPAPSVYAQGLEAFRKGEFAAAIRAWEPEAEAGNAAAQYYLGYMAQNGLGQPWSNARAAGYYRRAAEAGVPEAQLALGDLYLRGMGVEQDAARGAVLYQRAAASGDPRAMFEYGKLLLHGTGIERDPAKALEQFEAAAAAGLTAAVDFVVFAREAAAAAPSAAAAPADAAP